MAAVTICNDFGAQKNSLCSLVAQMVRRLPTMWETWVQSLDWEDLLEKEMAAHSTTLAWKIPWTEEPSRLQSMGSQRVGHDWATSMSMSLVSPSICHEVMGPDAMILVFGMLSFKPGFSLSFFTFIKRLFSSNLLSAIRMVSLHIWGYWYFSLQPIPACASFSPAFHMMYSAYKLNKQGGNIQPWCAPFPIMT